MNNTFRKIVRSLLVYFPFSQGLKPMIQRGYHNLLRTPFEPDFRALELFPDSSDHLYLDVGGNNGLAVGAIHMYKPKARIISFEPNRMLAEKMSRVFRRNSKISVNPFGLGERETHLPLFVPAYKGRHFDGLASIYRSHAEASMNSGEFLFFDKDSVRIHEYPCEIRTLDSLNLSPFFIKLDVQGAELSVLKGGEKTISRSRPVLLIESVSEEHMEFLGRFGYKVYSFDTEKGKFVRDARGRVNSFVMTDDKIDLVKEYVG